MPGRPRRGKGKYSQSKKRKKDRHSRPAIATQPSAAAQMDKSVSSPKVSVPATGIPATVAKPSIVQHPYIAKELRTIGIIAGIMLAILIVLAIVLR